MQATASLWETLCRDFESEKNLLSQEQHQLAAEKFKDTALQIFSANSARFCDAVEIAGDVCKESGFLNEAIVHFKDSLTQNITSGRIASAARVAAKLAFLTESLNDDCQARTYYTHALELFEKAHDYSQHCVILSSLAALEKRAGNFASCEEHYLRALEFSIRSHGEIHPQVALMCNNLAVAYTEAGNWLAAEHMHMRALGIREQIFGAMHPDVAESLSNLAIVYHSSKDFTKAESYYEAALKTYGAFRKSGDPEIEFARTNLESLRCQRN